MTAGSVGVPLCPRARARAAPRRPSYHAGVLFLLYTRTNCSVVRQPAWVLPGHHRRVVGMESEGAAGISWRFCATVLNGFEKPARQELATQLSRWAPLEL